MGLKARPCTAVPGEILAELAAGTRTLRQIIGPKDGHYHAITQRLQKFQLKLRKARGPLTIQLTGGQKAECKGCAAALRRAFV